LLGISRDTLHTKIKKNKERLDRETTINSASSAEAGEAVGVDATS
jgi:hypothetical protein